MSKMNRTNLDAAESIFLTQQLESLDKRLYMVEHAEMKARTLLPTANDVPEYARVYKWSLTKRYGRAKVISRNAKDIPRVGSNSTESTKTVKDLAASFGWNIFDIQASAGTGMNLDQTEAMACRFAVDEEIDEILATGKATHNLEGLLNLPGVGLFTLGTKAAGGTAWANATPDEIVKDVADMITDRISTMKGAGGPVFRRFVLVLPDTQYGQIATRRIGDGSSVTILNFLREATSQWLEAIEPWHRCENAGAGGTVDRMVLYPRNELVLTSIVPREFTALPMEQDGLEFVTNCIASTGGVVVRYPIACQYADGL